MESPETHNLVLNLILYVMLPLWGFWGFVDWCCHRKTKIESTSGLHESLLHVAMGVQVGIPIILSIVFEMNVLVMLCCFLSLICHELVAHYDVHYTTPHREISIWVSTRTTIWRPSPSTWWPSSWCATSMSSWP